jgi:hypothetical protein
MTVWKGEAAAQYDDVNGAVLPQTGDGLAAGVWSSGYQDSSRAVGVKF